MSHLVFFARIYPLKHHTICFSSNGLRCWGVNSRTINLYTLRWIEKGLNQSSLAMVYNENERVQTVHITRQSR